MFISAIPFGTVAGVCFGGGVEEGADVAFGEAAGVGLTVTFAVGISVGNGVVLLCVELQPAPIKMVRERTIPVRD
jgi:hypothetical protein